MQALSPIITPSFQRKDEQMRGFMSFHSQNLDWRQSAALDKAKWDMGIRENIITRHMLGAACGVIAVWARFWHRTRRRLWSNFTLRGGGSSCPADAYLADFANDG
jgi:hypothetical protein